MKILDDPPESLIFPPALRILKHALTCNNDLTSPPSTTDPDSQLSTEPSHSIQSNGGNLISKVNDFSTNDVKEEDSIVTSTQFAHRTMVESHDSDDILNGKPESPFENSSHFN